MRTTKACSILRRVRPAKGRMNGWIRVRRELWMQTSSPRLRGLGVAPRRAAASGTSIVQRPLG